MLQCVVSGLENVDPDLIEFHSHKTLLKTSYGRRFNPPATNVDIAILSKSRVPKNTVKSKAWALQVFHDWIVERDQQTIVRSRSVDPHQCIQVVEFQECSAYARQDATVMCTYTDIATNYVLSHFWNGLKLSAENYRMWLYRENSYVQTR